MGSTPHDTFPASSAQCGSTSGSLSACCSSSRLPFSNRITERRVPTRRPIRDAAGIQSMKQPLSQDALDQLFNNARSYNGYLDKPVTEAQLRAIWDLLKMGPTSVNILPARLMWCVSPQAKEKKGHRHVPSASMRCVDTVNLARPT